MPTRNRFASTRSPGRVAVMAVMTLIGLVLFTACGSPASGSPPTAPAAGASAGSASGGPAATQAPVPAESNPPGDIPDTTVYVGYQPPNSHVTLKVPEGWSRKDSTGSATFASNLNSISVAWMNTAAAPTVSSVRATIVPTLQRTALAFTLVSVRAVTLRAGPAVETIYQVNSPPSQVTGRQYRLVIERFDLSQAGHGVVLSLSSAVGSDNVDPWRIVSESLTWS